MATPRTATATHKRMRRRTLERDRAAGVTHCPGYPGHPCGVPLDYDTPQRVPNKAEADEIVPFAMTGTTSTNPDDWQTLCARCNQSKGSRSHATRRDDVDQFPLAAQW